jgi:hypothetical protein
MRKLQLASLVFVILLGLCAGSLVIIRERRSQLNDLAKATSYLIDIPSLLGTEWIQTNESGSDHSDMQSSYTNDRVIQRSWQTTRNVRNDSVFIQHYVIQYVDSSSAKARYDVQNEFLIDLSSGVPKSGQQFPFGDLPLESNVALDADEYQLACRNIIDDGTTVDTNCVGLFRYRNYVVYINMFPWRDGTTYLQSDDLMNIIQAINHKMKGIQSPDTNEHTIH